MTGYRDSDEQTAEAMRDGVYHTGDVALRDDDGYLTFVGPHRRRLQGVRLPHLAVRARERADRAPAVAEAAVVPSPDPVRLAVPKAFVALVPGHEPDEATARAILAFTRERLAPVQADPPGRVRRAAEDHQRQDPPRRAAPGRDRRATSTTRNPAEWWEEDLV